MSALKDLLAKEIFSSPIETAIWFTYIGTSAYNMATAAAQLAYLQACAAEWEFFAKMQGTDASKVAFMEQTVKKLAKLKGAG